MSLNPINGWNQTVFVVPEATIGTTPAPASVGAYAALAVEAIDCDLGPAESGVIRSKQDRHLGRGMQNGFVEGRVAPAAFSLNASLKSRTAVDTVPHLAGLFEAAGLVTTVNGATSYVLSPSATPIESGDFVPVTLRRVLGSGDADRELETLAGCVVRQVSISGGDTEVMLGFQGVGRGPKYTQGGLDAVTLSDGVGTALTVTAAESYALAVGYYQCEAEIIFVSAVAYGSTSATIARAQLGSTGAAHAAKSFRPYIPAGIAFTGAPISEALTTNVSVGGVALRATSWNWTLQTGLDLLPGETGAKYSQGAKYGRYDLAIAVNILAKGDDIRLLNRATQRALVAVSLSQGTAAGGVITLASTYCEVVSPAVSAPANDVAAAQLQFRVRDDGTGSNAFAVTLT